MQALRAWHWGFLCGAGLCLWNPLAMAVELPPGFVADTLATNLDAVTTIAPAPDGRIFIAEQTGQLRLWKNGQLLDQPVLKLPVADYWERGLIGLALAPDFARTAHIFILQVKEKPFVHHVLSRFTLDGDATAPESERILFEGDDQSTLGGDQPAGHQGGPLCFGADGKLYVALGEQTAGKPSQQLDTLQGKILRLNPDGSIPEDNPFFRKAVGKYRAIYALGVRNSFGLAAQPGTSRMFFTDVGGSAFEEVNELVAGANYGWPISEGFSTNAAFKQPLYAYPPAIGRSIVGAAFCPSREPEAAPGKRWPEKWAGRFFFGDFMNHWIKALDRQAPTNVLTFARGLNGPVALAFAPDGSLLVLNRGTIWRDPKRFVANSGSLIRIRYTGDHVASLPRPATTNFAALGLPIEASHLPAKLIRGDWERRLGSQKRWPIWLQSRAWHPGVTESPAGLYLPDGAKLTLRQLDSDLALPIGAVIVRQFGVPVSPSLPTSKEGGGKRIETRLLVIGSGSGYGASYRWDGEQEALLVEDAEVATIPADGSKVRWLFPGLDDRIILPISNPSYWVSLAPTGWVLPSRPEKKQTVNWLLNMHRGGVLTTEVPLAGIFEMRPEVDWRYSLASAEARIRSYLHGNCAVCHQPGGASRGLFDARITTPLEQAGLINGPPAAGDLGIAGAKIVVPGSPEKSILYQRLKRTDFFRMPPVAYHDEPSPILPAMAEWIRGLAPPQLATGPFGQAVKPTAQDLPPASTEGTPAPTKLSFRHHFITRDLPVRNRTTGDYGLTALVDIDRDGDLDFVLGGRGDRPARLYWFEYQSPDRWVQHLVGTNYLSDVGLAAHDVDGDGWIDLIASGVWYRNPTRPKEREFMPSNFAPKIGGAHDIVMADMDGDGKRDVVLMGDARTELNSIRWYGIPSDPNQTWTEHRIGEAVHGAFAPAGIGDLDGDGDNDVVRADTWFENVDGKGTRWLPHKNLPMGRVGPFGMCTRTVVIDIDGNGAQDLVVADADIAGSKVAILRNTDRKGGQWTRTDLPQSFNYGSLHALAVADFDGDNDTDIVAHEQEELLPDKRQNPRLVIWENLGQSRFAERIILDLRLGGHELQVGDVDGDSDIDICTKPWGPQPWNGNDGRMHVDYLENLTRNR